MGRRKYSWVRKHLNIGETRFPIHEAPKKSSSIARRPILSSRKDLTDLASLILCKEFYFFRKRMKKQSKLLSLFRIPARLSVNSASPVNLLQDKDENF